MLLGPYCSMITGVTGARVPYARAAVAVDLPPLSF
jgi:hypothetical protein